MERQFRKCDDMTNFQPFFDEYGSPSEVQKADKKLLSEYRDVVPEQLIDFWEHFGFGRYGDGRIWVINPKELEDVLTLWLPNKNKPTKAVPVLRTAFGKIIYWDDGKFTLLDPHHNDRFGAGDNMELLFIMFLVGKNARIWIIEEKEFKQAFKKFGPLKRDEMYSYKLPLAMGGTDSLKNMDKMKMREQLSILAQVH
jgi:hypothetical protein